jgi:hypothetical protein
MASFSDGNRRKILLARRLRREVSAGRHRGSQDRSRRVVARPGNAKRGHCAGVVTAAGIVQSGLIDARRRSPLVLGLTSADMNGPMLAAHAFRKQFELRCRSVARAYEYVWRDVVSPGGGRPIAYSARRSCGAGRAVSYAFGNAAKHSQCASRFLMIIDLSIGCWRFSWVRHFDRNRSRAGGCGQWLSSLQTSMASGPPDHPIRRARRPGCGLAIELVNGHRVPAGPVPHWSSWARCGAARSTTRPFAPALRRLATRRSFRGGVRPLRPRGANQATTRQESL